MINLVEVASRRNAKMLRAWRKHQTRNTLRSKLSRFITLLILVTAIVTIAITFIVRGL